MKIVMAEFWEWDSAIKVGSHHYARRFLAEGHEVFWMPSYWTIMTPLFNWDGFKKRFSIWGKTLVNGLRTVENGLYCYSPLSLLTYRNYPILNRIYIAERLADLTIPSLRGQFMKIGWDRVDIAWFSNLAFIGLRKHIEYKKFVYRMADHMVAFPDIPASYESLERSVIEKSDLVIATSRFLFEKAKKLNLNVLYLPNATNYTVIDEVEDEEPPDLQDIPQPRVIYVGSTRSWFDYELLESLARRLDTYSFVIIGPLEDASLPRLNHYENIYVLGPRPHHEVKGYMKHCEVGIIPFKKNELTERVNPIKLYEYLACGLPVVATNLEELRYLKSPALLATGSKEFSEGIETALQMGKDRREVIEFARENSWEKRFAELKAVLQIS